MKTLRRATCPRIHARPFSNPWRAAAERPRSSHRLSRSIENKRRRDVSFSLRRYVPILFLSFSERSPSSARTRVRACVRSSHPVVTCGARRFFSRARRLATEAGAVVVRSDRGSGWLSGDKWVAVGAAVPVAAAVGPGTALSLRLRGAGPCPPSRGHTTGAGRRVRGAGADADAAGPGPRRSIPSPAAF